MGAIRAPMDGTYGDAPIRVSSTKASGAAARRIDIEIMPACMAGARFRR
jgi:hypothetical protein